MGGGGGDTTAWHSREGLVPRGTLFNGRNPSTTYLRFQKVKVMKEWRSTSVRPVAASLGSVAAILESARPRKGQTKSLFQLLLAFNDCI